MEINKKYKLAIIAPVPFYYHIPFYRKLAQSSEIELNVFYCSDETLHGVEVEKTYRTKGQITGKDYLLEGYKYKFLKNFSPDPSFLKWPFGLINFGVWKEINRGHYDAVVLQSWTNLTWWMAFLACLLFKTPVLFMTDSNVLSEVTKSRWKRKFKKLLIGNLLFKNSSGFLTSGTANEKFYEFYGVPETKIVRVPFSWGYDWFIDQAEKVKSEREKIRQSLGVKNDDFVLLYVGRLAQEKFPLVLLEAYHNVYDKKKKLFIVGDGPQREQMERMVKEKDVEGVNFMGFQTRKNIFNFYAMADALVLPSRDETWGIVVNEAMCFGLPIIVSDRVGAGIDLVKKGYNGCVSKAGDVSSLSSCIEKIIQMPLEDRLAFGKRSKEIITDWINGLDAVSQMLRMLKIIKK
jgi:glycosyltransferase involved in cell wall biosynthesis